MTDREQILFERLLCLAANEYGKTREQMLAWVNDDREDWRTDYPKDEPVQPIDGALPFMQVTRTSTVRVSESD